MYKKLVNFKTCVSKKQLTDEQRRAATRDNWFKNAKGVKAIEKYRHPNNKSPFVDNY